MGLSWRRDKSSFEVGLLGSLNLGEGDRVNGQVSDKDLVFEGDLGE